MACPAPCSLDPSRRAELELRQLAQGVTATRPALDQPVHESVGHQPATMGGAAPGRATVGSVRTRAPDRGAGDVFTGPPPSPPSREIPRFARNDEGLFDDTSIPAIVGACAPLLARTSSGGGAGRAGDKVVGEVASDEVECLLLLVSVGEL